jgi:ankyrin repeat protein
MRAAGRVRADVADFLFHYHPDVHASAEDGSTALHWAAYSGCQTTIRLLLAQGSNVNVQSQSGYTALFIATLMGFETIVRLLLSYGANPELELNGFQPAKDTDLWPWRQADDHGGDALMFREPLEDVLGQILLDSDLDDDLGTDCQYSRKRGLTVRHLAAQMSRQTLQNLL